MTRKERGFSTRRSTCVVNQASRTIERTPDLFMRWQPWWWQGWERNWKCRWSQRRVMVWPLLLPFSSPFPFLPLPPPSVHLWPHLTPSAHPPPPSTPTLRHTHVTPCYIHGQTSLRLMPDLLRPSSHPRGTFYTPLIHLSNLSDLLSFSITGNCFLFLINPFLCVTHPLYIVGLK